MAGSKEKFKKEFIRRLVQFSINIIRFSDRLKKQKFYFSVLDQLVRSSTSIGANVVEAKGASSKKDYTKFFEIALKSAYETQYWLLIIKESCQKGQERIIPLQKEAEEIAKILNSSVLTLKGKK